MSVASNYLYHDVPSPLMKAAYRGGGDTFIEFRVQAGRVKLRPPT